MTPLLKPIPWETRNLGRTSFELDIAAFDATQRDSTQLAQALSQATQAHKRIFVQSRVECADAAMSQLLQEMKFRAVETAISPYCNLRRNEALQHFTHVPKTVLPTRARGENLTLQRADAQHEEALYDIARSTFTSDRFHLDPQCPAEIARERYVFWLRDLLRDDAIYVSALCHDATAIGFMARRKNALLLAGFTPTYASKGLGDFLWLATMQQLVEEGFGSTHTTISTGNISSLNLHSRLGWKFRDPRTTLHFWAEAISND